ncbi:hypothetical protein ARMGADRAFT_1090925 [Armillaria gallica]|uniref:Uncharacterized protein n=1 Tax=Armillaria gallica TaxID=47427 RepID=A0A2H3CTU6_ARMGA|nr:hypothetical protein ARMGADRAFT_1090925 [Armillaria gallica]
MIDEDTYSGIPMIEDSAAAGIFARNEIPGVHAPWDDEQMTAEERATDRLANSHLQGSRLPAQRHTSDGGASYYSSYGGAYTTKATVNPAGTTVFHGTANTSFPPSSHYSEIHMPELATPKGFQSHGFAPIEPSLGAATWDRATHAVRRPMPCPPGYEKKQFTHKMAHEIVQRHSIPYQDVYHYDWVDESYHHCPIAGCLSGENTFRGDAIKAHLELYHPNITTTKNVVCIRKSHNSSKCQPGSDVKGKSYELHFREKHSDAHSLCPFCGRRYRRADYLCRHFEKCKYL